jgi:hypothetical protein
MMRKSTVERVAVWYAVVGGIWFGFAAAWGLFDSVGQGHNGSATAGIAAMGESMLRWHCVYPNWDWYRATPPTPADYYTHHPFGVFIATIPFLAVFGHHDFVTRLPAVLMSAATPPLLFATMRKRWGAVGAAVTACGFTVVPLALGYANFHSLEVMTLFGWVLFFFGQARFLETRKQRHLLLSLLGVVVAASADWPGYIAVGVLLGWAGLRAFVLPRRLTPRFDQFGYARWWALSVSVAVLALMVQLSLLIHADQLVDWLKAGSLRSMGPPRPLSAVLASREAWIDYSFTPLAILLGKIALPVSLLRIAAFRRDEEVYGLAVLTAAIAQYLAFPQGADVHIFWPHHFALYFAFALGTLVTTAGGVVRLVGRRLRWARPDTAGDVTALCLGALVALMMLPDGWRALVLFRATDGRYDDKGNAIRSGKDTIWVIEQFVRPRMLPGMQVDAHPSVQWYWEDSFAAAATERQVDEPPTELGPGNVSHPVFVARASLMTAEEQLRIAQRAHVRVYGDVWLVDELEPAAPLDAYRVQERDPNPVEWLLYGPEPVRSTTSAPDPFVTWEWRTHLGMPAAPPGSEPRTLDELRIAHNVAFAAHDEATAERLRERIESEIDRSVTARFHDGTRIVGVRVLGALGGGRIQVWFEAGDPPRSDAIFQLTSAVERPEPLSLVPASPVVREMVWTCPLRPLLWKQGFLYVSETPLLHRTGYERYSITRGKDEAVLAVVR